MLDFSALINSRDFILSGLEYTVELTAITAVLGLFFGTLLALAQLSTRWWIRAAATLYINMMRAIPLVLVLYWFFLLMPVILQFILHLDYPVRIGANRTAIITFVMFESAYFAEIMRAGVQSVKKGQLWAAYGLGLTYWQTMRFVVIPQALRHMLPVLLTQTIIVFQDTSLVYIISANDFLGVVNAIAERDGNVTMMYTFVALVYLVISLTLSSLIRRLQKRIAIK